MSYLPTKEIYLYDKDGNVMGCTITQYGGIGTDQDTGGLIDVAFPDPLVIDMAVTVNETAPAMLQTGQNIQINCGWGSGAHEHTYMSLAPANAEM